MNIYIIDKIEDIHNNETGIFLSIMDNFENTSLSQISLPDFIQTNKISLRKRYLDWVKGIGERTLVNRSLKSILISHSGLSLWWMNLLNEKCNFSKSPYIDQSIQAIAIEEIISSRGVDRLYFNASSGSLEIILLKLCKAKNIEYINQNKGFFLQNIKHLLITTFSTFLSPFIGLASLIFYSLKWWKLKGVGVKSWLDSNASLSFVSYFASFKKSIFKEYYFDSNYWGSLTHSLREKKIDSKWIHIWLTSKEVPTHIEAIDLITKLNLNSKNLSKHVLVNSFIGFKVIFKVLSELMNINMKFFLIYALISRKYSSDSYLIYIHKRDFFDSLFGKSAAYNLLLMHLFKEAFNKAKRTKNCFYLQENQSWEVGLIHAYRLQTYNNMKIIGVPHTTIRFWDLRFSRIWEDYPSNLQPDLIASNGNISTSELIKNNVPNKIIHEVEALRYEYLQTISNKYLKKIFTNKPINILSIGEYEREGTIYQLSMLNTAIKELSSLEYQFNITLKPHPACPINESLFPNLNIKTSYSNIEELVKSHDFAVSSGQTTAAVDLYCFGMPVITCINFQGLNLSPLDGVEGSNSVSSPQHLKQTILDIIESDKNLSQLNRNYFNLDTSLSGWNNLLKKIGII